MSKLSKDRLNELKHSKNLTSKKIAEITGIPKSTVDKIFGGFNKNPTIENLQKIADVLDCSIDDFLDYDFEPVVPFYVDRTVSKLSELISEKPSLKVLLDICKNISNDDIKLLCDFAKRLATK